MDDYKIANRKLNCTVNVIIAFLLFPIMYYIRLFNIINREYYIISLLIIGFVTKRLCIQSNLNIHFNIIDQPLKKEILDKNKVKAESKLLFLKYVFHAIRVPLNSIALGLQVLKESSKFSNEDNDILSSMKDGKSDDIFNDDNL
jgi:signal transduction histidine kinase